MRTPCGAATDPSLPSCTPRQNVQFRVGSGMDEATPLPGSTRHALHSAPSERVTYQRRSRRECGWLSGLGSVEDVWPVRCADWGQRRRDAGRLLECRRAWRVTRLRVSRRSRQEASRAPWWRSSAALWVWWCVMVVGVLRTRFLCGDSCEGVSARWCPPRVSPAVGVRVGGWPSCTAV